MCPDKYEVSGKRSKVTTSIVTVREVTDKGRLSARAPGIYMKKLQIKWTCCPRQKKKER